MSHPSKRKGYSFEVEVCRAAEAVGVSAKRGWGSDGRAMGESPGVDCVLEGRFARVCVQAKRRAHIASWLKPPPGCDVVATREDRGETYYVVPEELFLRLLGAE